MEQFPYHYHLNEGKKILFPNETSVELTLRYPDSEMPLVSSVVAKTFENMSDLTLDADVLLELPKEHSFETALADLINGGIPLRALCSYGIVGCPYELCAHT
ncbi:structural maintenance of chromosomes flexible hinge domain-containing protein GMI1 [Senna tora]|uniref:Structural maintenance of chromosomes flexible hinge domain-containing protein GMI1 n=1 Tax=Senna tora TaxID=362788 RepID=A0A834U2K4_9FABA|nr:structural maintenance of chromosomes flexible hinge domain-containing protein GMI1 [Senna tora]